MRVGTQVVQRSPTFAPARRHVALLVVWLVTGFALHWVWPIQPRLTIGRDGSLTLGGLTPDGSKLITFTQRAIRSEDTKGVGSLWSEPSGPIQIWDLKSGKSKTVCLPDQSCSDTYVKTIHETWRMLEPNGWSANLHNERPTCRNNWFLFTMSRGQDRPTVRQMLLDLTTGAIRVISVPKDSRMALSPGGRWYVEAPFGAFMSPKGEIKLFETATGEEAITIENASRKPYSASSWCFSEDDAYFAASIQYEKGGATWSWKIETGEVVQTIDHVLESLTFAKNHHWIAGRECVRQTGRTPITRSVEIWDFDSTKLLNRRYLEPSSMDLGSGRELEFTEDDTWLLALAPSSVFEGGDEVHALLDLKYSWNLETNEFVRYRSRFDDDPQESFDPNVSTNGSLPEHYPRLFWTGYGEVDHDTKLLERTTAKHAFTVPRNTQPIVLTRDGKTLVLESEKQPWYAKPLSRLSDLGLTLPDFLPLSVYGPEQRWSVVDIPSGRTGRSIPAQAMIHWFSEDEKTLVTTDRDDRGISPFTSEPMPLAIRVWDFPFRKPIVAPFAWATVLPAVIVAWRWLRQRGKRRRTHPAVAT